MSLCRREGFGSVFPVSEIGEKGAVAEQFAKLPPSVLKGRLSMWCPCVLNLAQLDGKAACASQCTLLRSWNAVRKQYKSFILWCYFSSTIENSKIFCNAQCRLSARFKQCIQIVQHESNCICHCFVNMKGKVKHLLLALGEIALKFQNWGFETVSG